MWCGTHIFLLGKYQYLIIILLKFEISLSTTIVVRDLPRTYRLIFRCKVVLSHTYSCQTVLTIVPKESILKRLLCVTGYDWTLQGYIWASVISIVANYTLNTVEALQTVIFKWVGHQNRTLAFSIYDFKVLWGFVIN